MLHTKFQDHKTIGSGEDGSHICHLTFKHCFLFPMRLNMKFALGSNCFYKHNYSVNYVICCMFSHLMTL